MTTIAVFGNLREEPSFGELRAALPDDRFIPAESGDLRLLADAEVAVGGWSVDRLRVALAGLPNLRWVHTFMAGVDRFLPELVGHQQVQLTNNSGAFDVPIAEHVLAMIFAAAKKVPEHLAAQGRHEWERESPHAEVRDATLVILGLGSIGTELARLATGVGMRVIGIRRDPRGDRAAPGVERIVPPDQLADAVREADYLAVTAPLTPQTKGMVSADVIRALKPTAWLINIARGPIVDEGALATALAEKRIGGAALDVFDTEPLPATSPLWALDNTIITPHVSNSSPRLRARSIALLTENVRRFKAGEPLLNLVDRTTGY